MRAVFTMARRAVALLFVLSSAVAAGASTYTVTAAGNTFTIRRSDTSAQETVYCRTVSHTAVAGIHFTARAETLTFGRGEATKTILVTEASIANVPLQSRYQTGTSRQYRLEVFDYEGCVLADAVRTITYSANYSFNNARVSQNVSNLVYFAATSTSTNFVEAYSTGVPSSKFRDVAYAASSNWIEVTEQGYQQRVYTLSTDSLFLGLGVPREYFLQSGAMMHATVCFRARDVDDGYRYIQISSGEQAYDGNDPGATVGTPRNSYYKACFQLDRDASTSVGTILRGNGALCFFPHQYDNKSRSQEASGALPQGHSEFAYHRNYMDAQKFKMTNLRSPDAGALVLSPAMGNLFIRFSSTAPAGSASWQFKDLFVRLALVDQTPPTLGRVVVTQGRNVKFSKVTITLVFSEIMEEAAGTVLKTSWGDFVAQPSTGSRANAVSFVGYISADPGTPLSFVDVQGPLADLAGNAFLHASSEAQSVWATMESNLVESSQVTPPVQDNVVQISTEWDLYKYADMVARQPKLSARLMRDIDMNHSASLPLPAMGSIHGFAGTFDGNGHVIRNLQSIVPVCGHMGLFGLVAPNGVVKNVGVVGADIAEPAECTFGGISGRNYGLVEGCWFTGAYCAGRTLTSGVHGGIVGENAVRGTVRNCVSVNAAANALRGAVGANDGTVENVEFLELGTFASGRVCYILNGGVTDGTQAWYQRIGSDAVPTNAGPTVYYRNGSYVNSLGSLGSSPSVAPAFLAGAAPSVRTSYESWANRYGAAAAGANEAAFLLNADPASQVPDNASLLKVVDFRPTSAGFHLELASDVAPLTQNESQSGTSAVCNGFLTVYAATSPSAPRDSWTALSVPAVDAGNGRIAVDIDLSDFPAGQSADGTPAPTFFIPALTVAPSPSSREN